MCTEDIARALSVFPEIAEIADPFLEHWENENRYFELDGLVVDIITGDARTTLPNWVGQADAWFLDGFSPAKNPELWGADLLKAVAAHTKSGGSFATYTAAGFVRRALADAGFTVSRKPGFGRKRHMSVGQMEGRE